MDVPWRNISNISPFAALPIAAITPRTSPSTLSVAIIFSAIAIEIRKIRPGYAPRPPPAADVDSALPGRRKALGRTLRRDLAAPAEMALRAELDVARLHRIKQAGQVNRLEVR